MYTVCFTLKISLQLKHLLRVGNASLSQTDINGNNALHYAALCSTTMIDLLFTERPSDAPKMLNACNNNGETPLLIAIKNGNARCVISFMRHGAEIRGSKERSPLHEAMLSTKGTDQCTQ